MSKPLIKYIKLNNGYCGLSIESKKDILRRLGTDNVTGIRAATQADIQHVMGMGGYVPDGRIAKAEGA